MARSMPAVPRCSPAVNRCTTAVSPPRAHRCMRRAHTPNHPQTLCMPTAGRKESKSTNLLTYCRSTRSGARRYCAPPRARGGRLCSPRGAVPVAGGSTSERKRSGGQQGACTRRSERVSLAHTVRPAVVVRCKRAPPFCCFVASAISTPARASGSRCVSPCRPPRDRLGYYVRARVRDVRVSPNPIPHPNPNPNFYLHEDARKLGPVS